MFDITHPLSIIFGSAGVLALGIYAAITMPRFIRWQRMRRKQKRFSRLCNRWAKK